MTAVLTQPAHADETGRYPLAGLGGTGKTQLAAALAHSVWGSGEVDLLAWVPACSRDAVITGYAQALAATGAANPGPDLDSAAASFLGWLAETSRPWLVVLDDLADLADLEGLWPHGRAGLVVVTTRLPAIAVGARRPQDSPGRGVQPARGAELPDRPALRGAGHAGRGA